MALIEALDAEASEAVNVKDKRRNPLARRVRVEHACMHARSEEYSIYRGSSSMNSGAVLDLSRLIDHNFTKVAETSEIPVGKMKMVRIKDKEVLIANVNGNFYAIANPCTHRGGGLSEGSLEGNIVTCPIHGSKFDVTTGKNILGPKALFFRSKTGDATLHELRVQGENILLYQRSPWGV